MKLQQLRYVWEVAKNDLNVSVNCSGAFHFSARGEQAN